MLSNRTSYEFIIIGKGIVTNDFDKSLGGDVCFLELSPTDTVIAYQTWSPDHLFKNNSSRLSLKMTTLEFMNLINRYNSNSENSKNKYRPSCVLRTGNNGSVYFSRLHELFMTISGSPKTPIYKYSFILNNNIPRLPDGVFSQMRINISGLMLDIDSNNNKIDAVNLEIPRNHFFNNKNTFVENIFSNDLAEVENNDESSNSYILFDRGKINIDKYNNTIITIENPRDLIAYKNWSKFKSNSSAFSKEINSVSCKDYSDQIREFNLVMNNIFPEEMTLIKFTPSVYLEIDSKPYIVTMDSFVYCDNSSTLKISLNMDQILDKEGERLTQIVPTSNYVTFYMNIDISPQISGLNIKNIKDNLFNTGLILLSIFRECGVLKKKMLMKSKVVEKKITEQIKKNEIDVRQKKTNPTKAVNKKKENIDEVILKRDLMIQYENKNEFGLFDVFRPKKTLRKNTTLVLSNYLKKNKNAVKLTVAIDRNENYVINGKNYKDQPLFLERDKTYIFDQQDLSNENHSLCFSTVSEGSHTILGREFIQGVMRNGTPGKENAFIEINITDKTPKNLFYFCSKKRGLGGKISLLDYVKKEVIRTEKQIIVSNEPVDIVNNYLSIRTISLIIGLSAIVNSYYETNNLNSAIKCKKLINKDSFINMNNYKSLLNHDSNIITLIYNVLSNTQKGSDLDKENLKLLIEEYYLYGKLATLIHFKGDNLISFDFNIDNCHTTNLIINKNKEYFLSKIDQNEINTFKLLEESSINYLSNILTGYDFMNGNNFNLYIKVLLDQFNSNKAILKKINFGGFILNNRFFVNKFKNLLSKLSRSNQTHNVLSENKYTDLLFKIMNRPYEDTKEIERKK